jgi:hypothetical protein
MNDAIRRAIRDHANLLPRSVSVRHHISSISALLRDFVNEAYGLHYASGSDGDGVLFEACYSAVFDALAAASQPNGGRS